MANTSSCSPIPLITLTVWAIPKILTIHNTGVGNDTATVIEGHGTSTWCMGLVKDIQVLPHVKANTKDYDSSGNQVGRVKLLLLGKVK